MVTITNRTDLFKAQQALLNAAAEGAPVAELAQAAEAYQVAYKADYHRRSMKQMATVIGYWVDAIATRELKGVGIELHVTAHTDGFKPALRKRIKKAGGHYSECRGHTTTRFVKIPAASAELADEVFEACTTSTVIIRAPKNVWRALTEARGEKYPMRDQVHSINSRRRGEPRQPLKAPSAYVEQFVKLIEEARVEEGAVQ